MLTYNEHDVSLVPPMPQNSRLDWLIALPSCVAVGRPERSMATLAPSSAASTTWSGMCARQHVIFIIGVIVGARVGAEPRRVGQPLERPGERAVGRRAAAHLGDAHDDRLPHGGVCAARALLRLALGRLHAEGDAPARAEAKCRSEYAQL